MVAAAAVVDRDEEEWAREFGHFRLDRVEGAVLSPVFPVPLKPEVN